MALFDRVPKPLYMCFGFGAFMALFAFGYFFLKKKCAVAGFFNLDKINQNRAVGNSFFSSSFLLPRILTLGSLRALSPRMLLFSSSGLGTYKKEGARGVA